MGAMAESRDKAVYLRLTDSEHKAASELAQRNGITLQDLVRSTLRRVVGMSAPVIETT